MKPNAFRHTAIAVAIFGSAVPAFAQDCASNFQVGKNKAGGASYSTMAQLPGNSVEQAFQLSQQVVGQEGWKVYQTHPAQYAAFARNSQVTASGKTGELTFSTTATDNGMVLAIVYDNPPGVNSPANAVKDHFCKIADSLRKQIAAAPAPIKQVASANVAGANAAVVHSEPEGKVCLAKACLGMTLSEVAKLALEPAGHTALDFGPKAPHGGSYGLAPGGSRVNFSNMGSLDSKTMPQFAKSVDTICRFHALSASMKASDGQRIVLQFRPTMRNGKAILVVNDIVRYLPPNMSSSELDRFAEAARAQYGSLLNRSWEVPIKVTAVQLNHDKLRLVAPWEELSGKMLEQPGCSPKVSLE
jgi:hypothetical protein